jgi:branched-chain amino acid transport system permease protein
MSMTNILQLLVSGFAMGAIYTLTAKGLFITHLATGKLNFGQGDFLMVGAFLTMGLLLSGISPLLAVVAVLAAMALLGYLLERVAVRPLERSGDQTGGYAWVLTTAAIALILQNVVELIWGKSAQYSPPLFSSKRDSVIEIFGIGIFAEEAAIIALALVIVVSFYFFLFKTRWGKAVYAVAFNREAAALFGINVRGTIVLVFVVSALLAGVSGTLVGPLVSVNPYMGLVFTIKALAVASIGGFDNPLGILAGGLLFGIAEAFSNYWDSSFGDLYPLLAVLVLLAVKPAGLFGARAADVR